MQGYCEFYYAEVGGKMAANLGKSVDDVFPYVAANSRKIFSGKLPQISRQIDLIE